MKSRKQITKTPSSMPSAVDELVHAIALAMARRQMSVMWPRLQGARLPIG